MIMRNKNNITELVDYLLVVIFITTTTCLLLAKLQFVYAAAAPSCNCNDPNKCYSDGCTRKPLQGDRFEWEAVCKDDFCGGRYAGNCFEHTEPAAEQYFCVSQPPCCADMAKYNDPEACCWTERGYCHPFYCDQVSRPEKCGWYWTYHAGMSERPNGYGCTKGTSDADLQPIWGLPPGVPGGNVAPTAIPTRPSATNPPPAATRPPQQPTQRPPNQPQPTQKPNVPTSANNVPIIFPTTAPPPPSLLSKILSSLPKPSMPNVGVQTKIVLLKTAPLLDDVGSAGKKITSLDREMEKTLNDFLSQFFTSIVGFILKR